MTPASAAIPAGASFGSVRSEASPAGPTNLSHLGPEKAAPSDTPGTDDVAGQYYSFCIWWNGKSALWTNNDPYACEGWLDVYINGQHVAHLQNGGEPLASISCQLSVATGVMQVFTGGLYSGWGMANWLWSSWITGMVCRE
ncbi:hypothetical protein Achl_3353 [Pseudarthrobacter chlorophenolicus A6]|uniref:Uncharacterized protein n=1 Tax=Pseudarthrobacter chlorophenolicus (strain ATCC 700700 / DSM 12829 / CIP 107037 / JCM 12360 / KCTC 9906 / NCIMB 13794 / A6) TaxID=452863 RepID=B8HGP4_PSECP|nr:hypothetical protein Achl_3353 [Pseudarthrobacter chlorophenolicus A6]